MKHIKIANTWNLAANAQPQIPTLNLNIKISFQTCRGPNVGAPLGWHSTLILSHFQGSALNFEAQPHTRKQHRFWFSLGDVSLDFMTQIGTSMAVLSSFQNGFQAKCSFSNSTSIHTLQSQFHLYQTSNNSHSITLQTINSNYTQLHSLYPLIKFNYQLPLLDKATLQTQTAQRTPKHI